MSRYCDETVTIPSPSDDLTTYKNALLQVSSRPSVRTVLPVWESTVFVLSKYRDEFESQVRLAVPPFERLRDVQDRVRLVEVAERAGVPVPETHLLTDIDDWERELIVKSRYNLITNEYVDSYPPNQTYSTHRIKHLEVGEEPDAEELIKEMEHVPIVQEFVSYENEYVVGAICDRGETLATVQLRQIREDSYRGGGGVYRESMYDPELDRVVRDLLQELDWHGLACLEYMEDADTGEFKLTEINPRTWQSLGPTIRAGVDFPYSYWLLASGQSEQIDPEYELGVRSHFLKGEFKHLLSLLREDSPQIERPNFYATLADVAVSCVMVPHFDILQFDDPQPFVYDVFSELMHELVAMPCMKSPKRLVRRFVRNHF